MAELNINKKALDCKPLELPFKGSEDDEKFTISTHVSDNNKVCLYLNFSHNTYTEDGDYDHLTHYRALNKAELKKLKTIINKTLGE